MWEAVIYLRSEKRRPVRLVPYRVGEDLQGAVPYGWCPLCGIELYGRERKICELCERRMCDELE